MHRHRSRGIRDAKARSSELLRDIRNGKSWTITERGLPVARLVPITMTELSLEQRLSNLEDRGLLAPQKHSSEPLPPSLKLPFGVASRFLQADRGF